MKFFTKKHYSISGPFCQVKAATFLKIFFEAYFLRFVKNFFQKFLNFLILPDRVGFVKYFFQKQQKIFCQDESAYKKKKKIFLAPCQAFFAKNFFIFREILLDFTPKVWYNIYVRLRKGVLLLVKTFTKKFQKVLDLSLKV